MSFFTANRTLEVEEPLERVYIRKRLRYVMDSSGSGRWISYTYPKFKDDEDVPY